MKVLMIAPQPFFTPRGTPFSVLHRLKTISKLGHDVDLLTYCIGEDIVIDRVNIIRIPKVPFINKVAVGPSKIKILFDLLIIIKALILLSRNKYDLIHSHEEAGFFAMYFAKRYKTLHLYDMHSSLPQQLSNFSFTKSKTIINIFEMFERLTIDKADAVITICPELFSYVKRMSPQKYQILIENVVDDFQVLKNKESEIERVRKKYKLNKNTVIVYTGTFEPYQGLDLLIKSAKRLYNEGLSAIYILVGGNPQQVDNYQREVGKRNIADCFRFTGSVAPEEVQIYIEIADILVSPRIEGNNTPLKIYSYLRSGKPIVATRHITHTQVLNNDVAVLADCKALSFAKGIRKLIEDIELRQSLADKARKLSEEKYSYSEYVAKTREVYEMLEEKRNNLWS